jgi:hypothetical protein
MLSKAKHLAFSGGCEVEILRLRLRMTLRHSLGRGGGKRACPGLDPGWGIEPFGCAQGRLREAFERLELIFKIAQAPLTRSREKSRSRPIVSPGSIRKSFA